MWYFNWYMFIAYYNVLFLIAMFYLILDTTVLNLVISPETEGGQICLKKLN